jgi:uncharacterized surface anchored protein
MKYFLVLLFLASGFFAQAQTKDKSVTTTIHGTVADFTTKRPIEKATVVLSNGEKELKRVNTDKRGGYSFGQLAAGVYTIRFEAAAHKGYTRQKLNLKKGKKVRVVAMLK